MNEEKSDLQALREYLKSRTTNTIESTEELECLLSKCWSDFEGSDEAGMSGYKLHSRMESTTWEYPILSFRIERHGGTVMGSSRAEIHHWHVDVEKLTASVELGSFRQIRPIQPRLNVTQLIDDILPIIIDGNEHPSLKWVEPKACVRIKIEHIIPTEGPKQTIGGRRRRFIDQLRDRLHEHGWQSVPKARNTFRRTSEPSQSE